MNKIYLEPHLYRSSKHFARDDSSVPSALFTVKCEKPDFTGFAYPLPSKKSDYTCFAKSGNVVWFGAKTGLTRFDPDSKYDFDKVMFFSADRDLLDNNINALLADGNNVWVLTDTGVTYIEMTEKTPEEVSATLLDETLRIVERRGMASQRGLYVPRDLSTPYPWAHSDNDGGFSCYVAMSEMFRYDVLRKEKGENDPETIAAKANAKRFVDGCMFLIYVHGRGDGFVARTYVSVNEDVPDDGIFFRRNGDKAYCLETTCSKDRGVVGYEVDCSAPIPSRYDYLYKGFGIELDDIVYKADTSSDEITLQVLNMYFAHVILGPDDPELDGLIKDSVKKITGHILDNGLYLIDYSGKPTTWARWSEEYFQTEDGYVDSALNSAELLFYIKACMEITGEKGRWEEAYNRIAVERGYADLTTKHYDKMYQQSLGINNDFAEGIMYGDHFLATASFFGLCYLEKDETLLSKYRKGYKSWRTSIAAEHNPGYDFLYYVACPDEEPDEYNIREYFARSNLSRLAASVSLVGRHDIPVKELRQGYKQTSTLLPRDEMYISKYDRDPFEYKNEDSGGMVVVESCYVYTFAYWFGRYFGFIG